MNNFDPQHLSTLETILSETRNEQNQLLARLREAEGEVEMLQDRLAAVGDMVEHTSSMIEKFRAVGSGGRSRKRELEAPVETDLKRVPEVRRLQPPQYTAPVRSYSAKPTPVAYLNQTRGFSARTSMEPLSNRFSDRTITQACTLLLREAGVPLHVNELYNLLVAGGMEFKGNNPTISVAVSLNRNRRFVKVGPGTFDLMMREASQSQAAS
ncbi:MAG: hypothetical protein ABIU09_00120 [Pyrinomonadaceae bacterium]